MGPGFSEPVSLDFDLAKNATICNLNKLIENWSTKEKLANVCFDGWKVIFLEILDETIDKLKAKYNIKRVDTCFKCLNVKDELTVKVLSCIFCAMPYISI